MSIAPESASLTAAKMAPSAARNHPANQRGRSRRVQLPHRGGLDGLRGLAVVAVILYHGGVRWAQGGFLGVEVFFVLSGYLITSLLVGEWLQSGQIALGAFWARRARRLLPALFAVLVVIGIYYAAAGPTHAVTGLWGNGLATLLYFGNWHAIADSANYFVGGGPVSPLQHTWSLAIEEQFYAVWPLVVLGVLWVAGRTVASRRRPSARWASDSARLRVLLAATVTVAVASAVEMAFLFHGGRGLNRVYYGTDTRAGGLLIGAALAIVLARRRLAAQAGGSDPRRERPVANPVVRGVVSVASAGALVGVLVEMWVSRGSSAWLFPYGLVVLDLAVVAVIAAIVLMPGSLADRALSTSPLRATGRISYGLYLWHFPLFLWLNVAATGVSGVRLLLLRVGVAVLVSVLSYVLIEQPIRQRRWPAWRAYGLTSLGGLAAVVALLVASSSSALSTGVVAASVTAPPGLAGSHAACSVALQDTPQYGTAPIAPAQLTSFEVLSLGRHPIVWSGSSHTTYRTCPPKRVLWIGDSLSFVLGTPMLDDEQRYGVEIANAAMIGCAFSTRGEIVGVDGTLAAPDAGCGNALSTWAADEQRFHPSEVVIELGYRDEFDWRWHGRTVHLGQPAFDAYLQSQIDDYVRVLGRHGTKVLFLSVPYTNPPAQADGSALPAASPARHEEINAMLATAARRDPGNAAVLDLDRTISPGGHYDATVDGQPCRLDGIHPSVFCAKLVEPRVLTEARALLDPSSTAAAGTRQRPPRSGSAGQ
jgi:peptidoglycan/LPS O-acetylase OafA/YrhL